MKINPNVLRALLVAGLAAGNIYAAEVGSAPSTKSTYMRSDMERQVLSDLHKTNQKEIQLGQLAQQKGASAEVRNFGQHLIKDHQEADAKVTEGAATHNLP